MSVVLLEYVFYVSVVGAAVLSLALPAARQRRGIAAVVLLCLVGAAAGHGLHSALDASLPRLLWPQLYRPAAGLRSGSCWVSAVSARVDEGREQFMPAVAVAFNVSFESAASLTTLPMRAWSQHRLLWDFADAEPQHELPFDSWDDELLAELRSARAAAVVARDAAAAHVSRGMGHDKNSPWRTKHEDAAAAQMRAADNVLLQLRETTDALKQQYLSRPKTRCWTFQLGSLGSKLFFEEPDSYSVAQNVLYGLAGVVGPLVAVGLLLWFVRRVLLRNASKQSSHQYNYGGRNDLLPGV